MSNRRGLFGRKQPSFVASAAKIKISNFEAVKQTLQARQKWQEQAWETFDAVGQVKYGVSTLAFLASRVQLHIAEVPKRKNEEPTLSDHSEANETLERLGNVVTIADLMADLGMNLLVAGECYLVCIGARPEEYNDKGDITLEATDERWLIRSVDEVAFENSSVKVSDTQTSEAIQKWVVLDESKGDTFIRIWRQHPRRHHLADSHIRGILDSAEELLWWGAAARARVKSRLSDSGIVAIPSDMELPAETEEDEKLTGSERTAKRMQDTYVQNIQNPGTAGASSPIISTYPANEQRKSGIEHIVIDRPQDDLFKERVERNLLDIEQGINLPAGVISGLGTATHWGGGQIEESTFRDHVEPLVLLMCAALTSAFLHPILRELGVDPSNLIVWYDASNLILHENKGAQSNRGLELIAINYQAWRRENGYSETDAPTEEERREIIEALQSVRSAQNQGIVENPQKPQDPKDPNAPPQKPSQPGGRTPQDQPAAPLRRTGQSKVAAAIQVMADEKIRRAQEKAGNKLRSRAKKVPSFSNALRGVKSVDVARTLGREACLQLGLDDIFDGCFDDAGDRFLYFVSQDFTLNGQSFAISKKFNTLLRETAAEVLFAPKLPEELLISLKTIESLIEA